MESWESGDDPGGDSVVAAQRFASWPEAYANQGSGMRTAIGAGAGDESSAGDGVAGTGASPAWQQGNGDDRSDTGASLGSVQQLLASASSQQHASSAGVATAAVGDAGQPTTGAQGARTRAKKTRMACGRMTEG